MNSEQSNQNSEQSNDEALIDVNGEKLTIDELKKGYLRQSDYTKKTQELKTVNRQENSDEEDVQKAIKLLKENGLLTREDLENEKRMERLFSQVPEISDKRKVIEDLSRLQNKSPEDIIVQYGFADKAKLDSISTSGVMGSSLPKEKEYQKSISEMSDKEYEDWKKKNVKPSDLWS